MAVALWRLRSQTAASTNGVNFGTKREGFCMISRRVFIAAALVGIMVGGALAQSTDPLVGTWKISAEKTKGAKSGTTVIEAAGKGLKWTVDLVGTDGSTSHWSFTANYDGKDVPITGNSPYGNTVSLARVDAK